jgi:cytochrome c-type biogenesis protein CcmH
MTSLVLSFAALIIFVMGVLFWVLFKSKAPIRDYRSELNVAVYQDQLAELAREKDQGSLSDEDLVQAQTEIQRRVLEDTQSISEVTDHKRGRGLAVVLLLMIPLASVGFYMWLGHPDAVDPKKATEDVAAVTQKQILSMVEKLKEKLSKNPDDLDGWAMLARSEMNLDQPKEAVKAFDHLQSKMANNPGLMTEYAEALAASGEDAGMVQAQSLVKQALALEPGNPKGLFLAGGFSFGQRDFAAAVKYWTKLMPLLESGSQDANFVLENLNVARAQMKLPAVSADQFQLAMGPSTAATANPSSTVSGTLTIADNLKGQWASSDTIYIFARAINGPRIPLAVFKTTAQSFPIKFELTDAMAMNPQFNLSSVDAVRIEARLSKSGSATPHSGDLIGSTLPVKPGSKELNFEINQVQP